MRLKRPYCPNPGLAVSHHALQCSTLANYETKNLARGVMFFDEFVLSKSLYRKHMNSEQHLLLCG